MPAEGPAEGGVQRFGSTVASAVPVTSAQRMSSQHSTGNGGIVTGVGGWGSSQARCAAWPLMPPDTRAMPWSGSQ